MRKHNRASRVGQVHQQHAQILAELCFRFLKPLLHQLNNRLDRRLVRTFLGLIESVAAITTVELAAH